MKARRTKELASVLALSKRPGTTATPCLSAAWANAPLSAAPKKPATIKDLDNQQVDVSPDPPQNVDSAKTMESKKVPGLFFIGEVVDVTGHLGGFNFQWAWASGMSAGRAL